MRVVKHHLNRKIEQMRVFCDSNHCRRVEMLRYFGETYQKSQCDFCDNCISPQAGIDGTEIAQKILSCVHRLRYRFGINYVVDVLTGSKNKQVLNRNHDTLSTYGILSDHSKKDLRYYIYALINQGLLVVTEGEYPVLRFTSTSQALLKGEGTVQFKEQRPTKPSKKRKVSAESVSNDHPDLYRELKNWRTKIADHLNVPPYIIFSNKVLMNVASERPTSMDELLLINGVGPKKLDRWGAELLQMVGVYSVNEDLPLTEEVAADLEFDMTHDSENASIDEHPVNSFSLSIPLSESSLGCADTESVIKPAPLKEVDPHLPLSVLQTAVKIQFDSIVEIDDWVSVEKRGVIQPFIQKYGLQALIDIWKAVPDHIEIQDILWTIAYMKR